MRFRSLVISLFGVLCGFMLIAGVVESGAAERKADQLDPVVFAIPSLSAEYLPLVIAEEKGFYRPAGIRPQIQAIKSAVALTGTSTGDVAYVFASTSTIGAVMQGLPLRVVAYVNVGSFFLFSRPEIRTIADLKGKVIAQATVAGLQDYLLKAMLKANGLDPTRDVQYVSLGDDSLGLAAVKSGQVHAAIAQVPTPLIAEKEGLRIIGNTADFARFPTAAIGTSLERMKSRPQEVKEVIRGTLLGIRYITEHHEESAQILSRWQKVSLDVAQRTLELLRPSWVVNGFLSDEEIRAVIDERKASLKITREIAPADVVDYRFLKEAQKELGGSK